MRGVGGDVGVTTDGGVLFIGANCEERWLEVFKEIKKHHCAFKSVEVAVKKVAFYSSDCHSESRADPDCLSLWVCVTSNMLGPGQKTYCSVAKKLTVNWMLSAHCWRTPCDPQSLEKNRPGRHILKSYSCPFLCIWWWMESCNPGGQRVDMCSSLNTICLGLYFVLFFFFSKLFQIRAPAKCLKYECRCKMYESETREAKLKRRRSRKRSLSNHLSRLGLGNSAKSPQIWWNGGVNKHIRAHKHINTRTHPKRSQPWIDLHRVFTPGSVPNCKQNPWK